MTNLTKKRKQALSTYDNEQFFSIKEASSIVKKITTTKFDSSVDMAIRLGVDPKKPNQMIRGVVSLPHGTGKALRIAVFAKGDKATEADEAGADIVGADDLAEKIQNGEIEIYNISVVNALPPRLRVSRAVCIATILQ